MTTAELRRLLARATTLLSELVEAGEVVPPRGSAGWKPSDVRVRAWENAQEKARRFLEEAERSHAPEG